MKKIKVGICQLSVKPTKEENLSKAEDMIREAANNNCNLVVLPEMFTCPYSNDNFPKFAEDQYGPSVSLLSELAKELSIYIIGGSIPESVEDKLYNTCFIFNKEGKIIDKHSKMHLFDIDVKDKITFRESDTLSCGNKITVFETEYCKIGVAICYDMRFPELMRLMALKGAEIIIVPAAFNMTTGPAHWHTTAKMRAVDNQVYFMSVSPARDESSVYVAYGHSLIVSPWGDILAEANEKETILYGELDLEKVNTVRQELPLLKHMRKDIYYIEEKTID